MQKTVKDLQIDISDCTSTSTINQKKKSKRENNRNDKKKNQQGYAGKNKMSHNTE